MNSAPPPSTDNNENEVALSRKLLQEATSSSCILICVVVGLAGFGLVIVGCANGGLKFFAEDSLPRPALFVLLGIIQIAVFVPYAIVLFLLRVMLRLVDQSAKTEEVKKQEQD